MKKIVIYCIAALSWHCAAAIDLNSQDSELLLNYLEGIDNLKANFVQQTIDGNQNLLQTQEGALSLSRPNKFKWQSHAPYEQVLVSNGTTLWQFDPDLEQVTIQKLDQRISSTPVLLLSGDSSSISKEYEVYSESMQQEMHFVLIPRRNDVLFDRLRLEFSASKALVRMIIKDEVGQKTVISLSNHKQVAMIQASEYEFTPPDGVDVIKSQ